MIGQRTKTLFRVGQPVLALLVLSGCIQFGNNYSIHTTLAEDGSLKREITTAVDSSLILKNHFNAYEKTGWQIVRKGKSREPSLDSAKGKNAILEFSKIFSSIDEANQSMSTSPDATFKITAASESSFRWFYTDLVFSETYMATLRFSRIKARDFFDEADFMLMERNAREGKKRWDEGLAKDSVRQQQLTKKIDAYAEAGVKDEVYLLLLQLVEKKGLSRNWQDSLSKYKTRLFTGDFVDLKRSQALLEDTLKIPIQITEADEALAKSLTENLVVAYFDEFEHSITIPFDIFESNADSVAGRSAFWKSRAVGPQDVLMTVTARKINYWSIMITVFLFAAISSAYYIRKSVLISRE